jgi:hypothetical protein
MMLPKMQPRTMYVNSLEGNDTSIEVELTPSDNHFRPMSLTFHIPRQKDVASEFFIGKAFVVTIEEVVSEKSDQQ